MILPLFAISSILEECREEKSLCHVAMEAKFFDDKPKKSLIKMSICTISNITDLIQFHLIWQILAKFSLGLAVSIII